MSNLSIYRNKNGFENVIVENEPGNKTNYITIMYPDRDDPQYLILNLCDVRANNGIRIHFDFERDCWVIERPTVFEWQCDDEVCDPCFEEVALVQDADKE